MNNSTTEIQRVQEVLYVWMSKFEKRSLSSIRSNCEYLNDVYNLNLSNPIWGVFWPLVFNGVIDHVGKGYYSLTSPFAIKYENHIIWINHDINNESFQKISVGIGVSDITETLDIKTMVPNVVGILKEFPAISDVIDSFPKTLQDESKLKYINWKKKRGLAEIENNGLTRYFSIPEKLYIRELPSRLINPEAYALAYCYTLSINEDINGSYDKKNNELKVHSFGFPYMLYRALIIETLSQRELPEVKGEQFIFHNIPMPVVKELNRILCNSISYE